MKKAFQTIAQNILIILGMILLLQQNLHFAKRFGKKL